MRKIFCVLMICILFASCGNDNSIAVIGGADGPTSILVTKQGEKAMYEQITQQKAKEIMDSGEEYILLDVREQEEFDEGHIKGAVLLPHTEIEAKAQTLLPDKDKLILVYCRSGRRSKIAATNLSILGYTNIKEFGGITDWKYEIEK